MLTNVEDSEALHADVAADVKKPNVAGTYLTFDLSGQILGVQVRHVREILDQVTVSLLPNSPSDIEGVIDIRGESIPIIDMGSRLGLPRSADNEETRIIVFEVVNEGTVHPIGVLADKVRDVTQITMEQIENPPSVTGASWDSTILHGFARQGSQLLLLLDVSQVFSSEPGGMIDMAFV